MTSIEFGNRLADLRKGKGYSQDDLAEKLGVSRQAISKWERGEATPDTTNLIALASLYGTSLDSLVFDKPGKKLNEEDNEESQSSVESAQDGKKQEGAKRKKLKKIGGLVTACLALTITAAYVTLGCLFDSVLPDPWVWKIGWIFYLLIPAWSSVFEFVCTKDYKTLMGLTTAVSVFAYMILGMQFGYWHPGWVVFLLIPVTSVVFEALNRGAKK